MLKDQSGDLVGQLQAKIKELMETHERVKTEMQQEHETQRKEMTDMFEKQKTVIIEEYERKLKELEARMNADFETMRTEM